MKLVKIISNKYKKYKKSLFYKAKFIYTKKYNMNIIDNTLLIQSFDGTSISGSPYYMLEEFCTNPIYNNLKISVVCKQNNKEEIQEFLKEKKFNVDIVIIHSKKYCEKLLTSKYLINNSTFPTYFIKKEEQVYLNTWHGIPLKYLGRKIKDAPNEIGNTQRNFLMADYLFYSNDYMFNHMREDYMLDNLFKGKYIIGDTPCNSIFLKKSSSRKIREELELKNKKIIVYMPTWRGNLNKKENKLQLIYINHLLSEMNEKLGDEYVIFYKFHSLTTGKIIINSDKIYNIPKNYEIYEFLSAADYLITDYSSVMFDFANTNRKIILYAYDKEKFIKEKGFYLDYGKLPFPIVENTTQLIEEIIHPGRKYKYEKFNTYFNSYNTENGAKKLCNLFINKENSGYKIIDGNKYASGKDKVLVFAGSLAKNGITTALKGLMNNVSKKQYDYYLTFYKSKTEKNKHVIHEFKDIDYIPIQGGKNITLFEAICQFCYYYLNIGGPYIQNKISKINKREFKRLYLNENFKYLIHYSGYEKGIFNLFVNVLNSKRIFYVHNDMKKEFSSKGNIHKKTYKNAVKKFDNIITVRNSSKKEVINFFPNINKEKIKVAHNLNNITEIVKKSEEKTSFDNDTYCNINQEELEKILNSNSKTFVNIGRFSKEKGHIRLIDAFNKYKQKHKNSYLIIIGGYGKEFEQIKDTVSRCENVILIKSISNPYPILKRASLFVLSSYYEGLPMTIMEALILNIPVLSTDIPGPSEFLSKGYGYLVDNSERGIYEGMLDFSEQKLKKCKAFDANNFNKQALEEFYNILESDKK